MKYICNRNRAEASLFILFFLFYSLFFSSSDAISEVSLREKLRQKLSRNEEGDKRKLQGLEKFKERKGKGAPVINISGRNVAVWEASHSGPGKIPVIIFSHGYKGCNVQSASLMEEISKSGFTIFAPNHLDASCNSDKSKKIEKPEFGKPDKWSEDKYKDRRDDIVSVIEGLKADPKWASQLDFSKLALIGHSLGGYTALGLSGAWSSWEMPGVKAVLAWSPYASPFIVRKTLGQIHIPIMYQGGTRDMGITPHLKKGGGAFDQAKSRAYFVNLQDAGHFSWTEFNKKQRNLILSYSLSFLKKYVLADQSVNLDETLGAVAEFKRK
jgi:predicted dienelactone hydrolase